MSEFFAESNIQSKLDTQIKFQERHDLWVEKYRPVNLDTFIGNDLIKDKSKQFISNNDIPHLLLYGRAGGGKTTLAKILANNLKCDVKYINASDENSIDDVRTKVKSFASTLGFYDLKIMILDECDYLSINGQAALRNLMETYSKSTRFILTCVANGTKIYTPFGYKLVEDIKESDLILTKNSINTNEKLITYSNKNTFKLKTRHGFEINVTDNHKFNTKNDDYMMVKDLHVGDNILINLSSIYGNDFKYTNTKLKIDKNDFILFCKKNKIPNDSVIRDLKSKKDYILSKSDIEILNIMEKNVKYDIFNIMNITGRKKHILNKFLNKCKKNGLIQYINANNKTEYIRTKEISEILYILDDINSNNSYEFEYHDLYKILKSYNKIYTIEFILKRLNVFFEYMTDDMKLSLGRLLGFIYGDGHLSHKQIHYTSLHTDTLLKVYKDLNKFILMNKFKIKNNNSNGKISIVSDYSLSLLFKFLECPLGNKTIQNLHIPTICYNDDLIMRGYIQALFDNESLNVTVLDENNKTLSPILLRQHTTENIIEQDTFFQEISDVLMKYYDINSYIDIKERTQYTINGTYRIIKKLYISTQSDIKKYFLKIGNYYEEYKKHIDFLGYLLYKENMTGYKYLDFYEWRKKYYVNGIINDDIIDIQQNTEEYIVNDISMKYDHSYISNGFISHNCNYPEKIIDPIISRCQVFELIPPSKKDIAKHVATILNSESVKFDANDLAFLIKAYYPDIRKIINNAQLYSNEGILKINQKNVIAADYKLKIIDMLSNKDLNKKDTFNGIRQLLADSQVSDFTDMYTLLYDSIDDYAKGNIAQIIIILADMQGQSSYVVDKEISFMSCIIQILDKIK